MGKKREERQILFSWAPESLRTVTAAAKLTDACVWAVSDSQERDNAGVLEHSWHMQRGRGAMEQAQTQDERRRTAFPQPRP